MKKIYQTVNAPAPVGPYNQAVSVHGILYVSGQIAIDPKTGEFVTDNIQSETNQVMKNIQAILLEAGATFENVVKASIFLANMDDFADVNKVYASYFNEITAPARECVEVSKLPKNVSVEISVIAHL
ncbi:reactive intermediate/imine deaminase [Wenyingzhuangia fucanilytica]|uniref:Reactive intermediate/imine deaminase n=1 Tax=Wenyingzhuangia fucanilytica TaxID=1790137 RepID=A0A1B1Y6W5_9FLAO|nr:Rid family detoxifying hydrolase [Wenyingzhuangia fucanilytica]ANW96505.1 reactive intermediate/imine deaminase [Wenyingzhuangia fucanilytica]